MKITTKLILLLFVIASCTPNRYLLNDEEPDNKFLSDFITELASMGEISKHPLLVIDGKPKRWNVELKEEKLSLKKEEIANVEKMDQKIANDIYGDPAKGGVILITTKQKVYENNLPFDKHKVLYFLNGNPITLNEMLKIDPNNVQSITVIKNKEQMESYTEEPEKYDGVILLTTK